MGDLANWIGIGVQTLAIVGTMAAFLIRINTEVKVLVQRISQSELRLGLLDTRMEKLSQVVVDLAKQDQRLNNVEMRVQELSMRLYEHVKKDNAA